MAVLKKRLHDKTGQYDQAMKVVENQKAAIEDLEENLAARHRDIEERDDKITE